MRKIIPGAVLALALTPFTFAQNTSSPQQSPSSDPAAQGNQTSTDTAPAKKQKKKKKSKGSNSDANGGSAAGTGNAGAGSSGSTTNPPTSR